MALAIITLGNDSSEDNIAQCSRLKFALLCFMNLSQKADFHFHKGVLHATVLFTFLSEISVPYPADETVMMTH